MLTFTPNPKYKRGDAVVCKAITVNGIIEYKGRVLRSVFNPEEKHCTHHSGVGSILVPKGWIYTVDAVCPNTHVNIAFVEADIKLQHELSTQSFEELLESLRN